MADKEQLAKAIQETLKEVEDLLAKSGYQMGKAEGDMPPPPPEGGMPPEGGGDMPPPAAEGGGDMPPAEGAAMQDGQQGDEQSLEQQAQELADEELDMMIEVLMSEKQRRQGGSADGAPDMGAPPPADAAGGGAPPPPEDPAMKSAALAKGKDFSSEMTKMAKSMNSVLAAVDTLSKEVAKLKTPAKVAPVAAKPAVTNRQQVLEKSTPSAAASTKTPQRLNKSESIDFLIGEVRKGNKIVDRDTVAEFNLAKSDEQLHDMQIALEKRGLAFPKIG